MRILYMGTPDFALTPLKLIKERGYEIVGVVTQPDKPQGRKMILTPSSVKKAAEEMNIRVFTPVKLKNEAFLPTLKELDPDLIVVVAYGRILPEYILDYPKYGCINLHGSLLPKYRGASPMQRSIMDGEKEVGATVMYMNAGMDTGDMIKKYSITLTDEMTLGELHDVLTFEGGKLLLDVIDEIDKSGKVDSQVQDDALASYAPKIENEDMMVDFSKTSRQVHNLIRGLSPSPLAFSMLHGKKIKFVSSSIVEEQSENDGNEGKVVEINKQGFVIACRKGTVLISALIPEGKKQMDSKSFINGRGTYLGDKFGELI